MKICTNCKVERNDDEYYSYWHSTQQKYRTRLICVICTREQSKQYKRNRKNKPAVINEEPTQHCPQCKKDLPLSGYYESGRGVKGRYCKSCIRKNQNDKNYKKVMSEGGSERIPVKPNTYTDEYQKAQTFYVLEALGWKYNDNGVWSKEGVKTADKVWVNIIPQQKRNKRPNGVIIKKKHGVHNYIPQIIKQREEGMTYSDLGDIYCCSHTTIRMIVSKYYNEKRSS
jgi:hypothetical protein